MKSGRMEKLVSVFNEAQSCVVAFSGGVDSTFLSAVAAKTLGKRALAVTLITPFFPAREQEEAAELAADAGIRHRFIRTALPRAVIANPADRCYRCKKHLFGLLKRYAAAQGFSCVLDGSNADDLDDFRPGSRALKELGVRSPLQEAGFTKRDIRSFSRRMGLRTWKKPSLACLASRFRPGERLTAKKLAMVEKAEGFLRGRGDFQLRVRYEEGAARIETVPAVITILRLKREEIGVRLRSLGFTGVTIDPRGYRMGSMNG